MPASVTVSGKLGFGYQFVFGCYPVSDVFDDFLIFPSSLHQFLDGNDRIPDWVVDQYGRFGY